MSIGQEVDVRCLGLAHGGVMICEITAGDASLVGKKAFVRGLIPGETAQVSVLEDRKSFVMASLVQISSSSDQRIAAPCPVFGECGGCDLQYMPVAAQREMKREMVEKTLQRQAKLTLREPVRIYGSDLPETRYRRRISLHLDADGKLGFYREGSDQVVTISDCLIASETVNALLPVLQGIAGDICSAVSGITIEAFGSIAVPLFLLRAGLDSKRLKSLEEMLGGHFPLGKIFFRDDQLCEWHAGLSEGAAIEFSTLRHFSQINEAGNDVLIEQVLRALGDESEVTEFYAGAGNFSFPLTRAGKIVDAVELDKQLVERGRAQVRLEKLKGLNFIADSTERYLDRGDRVIRQSVLLDPPRSGARVLCETLQPEDVRTIVYVSCALPTLTRDLAALVKSGFELVETGIIDMFPQTHHVESIAVLRRRA